MGFELYQARDRSINVQRVFISKNTEVPTHQHKDVVHGIVYRGKIELTQTSKTFTLGAGDFFFVDSEVGHSLFAIEDSWILLAAVPLRAEEEETSDL